MPHQPQSNSNDIPPKISVSLTLGIDASRAARARRTGTETYSLEIIKALAKCSPNHLRLRLYTPHPPQHTDWPDSAQVETRVIPWPRMWTHLRLAAELNLSESERRSYLQMVLEQRQPN